MLTEKPFSCSNCLDYQSRRLKIRFRDKTNEDTQYIHTLNSTLVATERTMVTIMENFQTKDGHVNIPNVLQKYMGKKNNLNVLQLIFWNQRAVLIG